MEMMFKVQQVCKLWKVVWKRGGVVMCEANNEFVLLILVCENLNM